MQYFWTGSPAGSGLQGRSPNRSDKSIHHIATYVIPDFSTVALYPKACRYFDCSVSSRSPMAHLSQPLPDPRGFHPIPINASLPPSFFAELKPCPIGNSLYSALGFFICSTSTSGCFLICLVPPKNNKIKVAHKTVHCRFFLIKPSSQPKLCHDLPA